MATELSADTPEPSAASGNSSSFWRSVQHAQSAIRSLSAVLGPLPDPHLAFSDDPAAALLRDPALSAAVSRRLRLPSSGAGDDHLCRWLYDTFHSAVPTLRLAVLSFLPALAGAYLSRSSSSPSHTPSGPRHPLAGFEAVLLALYAHETVRRGGEPETVTLPSLATPSIYHEVRPPSKKATAEADELGSSSASLSVVVSPALEPHGTVRSTRRARIVGVALELYYSNISQMPNFSKLEFCEFCIAWSGQGAIFKAQKQRSSPSASASQRSDFQGEVEEGKRIPLPWELFQPMLRIVGHCLLGPGDSSELRTAAYKAAQCLHMRAAREIDSPAAILASRSLIRLGKIATAEMEVAAEEAATKSKTAALEEEPAMEAAAEEKTAVPEAKEPATEAATEAKTAMPKEELATEAATEAKTAALEAKEPATEAKTATPEEELATEAATEAKTTAPEVTKPATEVKTAAPEEELATEATTEAKTAAPEAKEPATEAKESASEVKELAKEAKETEAEMKESSAAEVKEPATEAVTEAKTAATEEEPATEAKESTSEVRELAEEAKETEAEMKESSAAEVKELATEAAIEAKTAATEEEEPATEVKESTSEVKELAEEAKETAVEAKEPVAAEVKETTAEVKASDAAEVKEPAAEVKEPAAEANSAECSELESIQADAQSAKF